MKRVKWALMLLFLSLVFTQSSHAEIYTSISGTVTASDTGQGVVGVGVHAFSQDGHIPGYVETNEKGIYVLKNLKPGSYRMAFSIPDPLYITEEPHLEVILPRGKNLVNVNYVFKLGGSVSGTVYDADGVTPLYDERVSAEVPNPQPAWVEGFKTTFTDRNGKFLLQGLPESDNCIVEVEIRGLGPIKKTAKIIKGKVTEGINFVVKRDDITGISGYIKSSIDNKPIIRAEILFWDSLENQVGSASTDETGKYSIIGIPPGIYTATAFWPEGGEWIDKINIFVEAGKSTIINFEFNRPAPQSMNEDGLLNKFVNFFISNAYAAIPPGSAIIPPDTKKINILNCKPYSTKVIKAAIPIIINKINTSNCMSPGISTKLSDKILSKGLTIMCYGDACGDDCGRAIKNKNTPRLCFNAFTQKCGCLQATLFHEILHASLGYDEDKATGCEWSCFKECTQIPEEYEKYKCVPCN
jgi:hypothetical protein